MQPCCLIPGFTWEAIWQPLVVEFKLMTLFIGYSFIFSIILFSLDIGIQVRLCIFYQPKNITDRASLFFPLHFPLAFSPCIFGYPA